MSEMIPPTPEALEEALALSDEILKDVELSRGPLSTAALKAGRLARLLNHMDAQQVFEYEASGYPTTATGFAPDVWRLLQLANRTFQENTKTVAYGASIDELEQHIEVGKIGLNAAQDRNVSVSSANPDQFVMPGFSNFLERKALQDKIVLATQRLSSRRALIYSYVSHRYYELKFSGVAQNVFSAVREAVDRGIGDLVPTAIQKFASVHDNLRSKNPEDWSNAVHSCRRILQDLADEVFSAREDRKKGDGKTIKLGAENYINRLVCFAEDNSDSERFRDLVGSHLSFLGDRLDAVFQAAQKGSHSIVTSEEANRYVVYTYLLVGDILALRQRPKKVTP
jgi:hypothetical protein